MKNSLVNKEQNNRRRDIGSGTYWELLNKRFLDIVFAPGIREQLIYLWGGQGLVTDKVTWDPAFGIGTLGASDQIKVLVATPESCVKINNFLEDHIGSIPNDSTTAGPQIIIGRQRDIAVFLARHIKMANVIGYFGASGKSGVAEFKRDHFTQPGEFHPRKKLVSDHTVDTGKSTGIALRSVPTSQAIPVVSSKRSIANMKSIKAAEAAAASRSPLKNSLAALSMYFGQEEAIDQLAVNTFATADEANYSDDYIYTDSQGDTSVLQKSQSPTAPILKISSSTQSLRTTTSSQHWGSRNESYIREGTINNPYGVMPSSFFTPLPTVLSALSSPMEAIADNPWFLIAIMSAVFFKPEGNKYTHIRIKNELPTQIIDNAEIESKLLGG